MVPLTDWLILDVASAPIVGAEAYLEEPSAPQNYKDPAKIAAYIAEKKQAALESAALDLDMAVITAFGCYGPDMDKPCVWLAKNEAQEKERLLNLGGDGTTQVLITFNGHRFDLPLVVRRCLYLGVRMPDWNLDRYRSPHVDLWQRLSLNGQISAHSLSWYVKRFGWSDLSKPLTGAEESQVPMTGRWEELRQSVEHDLTATYRLAQRMGYVQ